MLRLKATPKIAFGFTLDRNPHRNQHGAHGAHGLRLGCRANAAPRHRTASLMPTRSLGHWAKRAVPKGIKGSEFCWNVGGKHFLWLSLLKQADTKNIVNPTSTWSRLIYCVLSQKIVQGRPSDALSIGNYPGHVKRTKLPTASSEASVVGGNQVSSESSVAQPWCQW